MADLLPPQYRNRYSVRFWKAFTAAALTAAYRLAEASERPIKFGCIAEELALHAFVEKAELVLEGWQSEGTLPESADVGFGTFLDAVAEDDDVSMLWQMELDGVDESEEGRKLGVASLRFDEWFTLYGNDRVVNPFNVD